MYQNSVNIKITSVLLEYVRGIFPVDHSPYVLQVLRSSILVLHYPYQLMIKVNIQLLDDLLLKPIYMFYYSILRTRSIIIESRVPVDSRHAPTRQSRLEELSVIPSSPMGPVFSLYIKSFSFLFPKFLRDRP